MVIEIFSSEGYKIANFCKRLEQIVNILNKINRYKKL